MQRRSYCGLKIFLLLVGCAGLLFARHPLRISSAQSSAASAAVLEIRPDLVVDFSSDYMGFVEPCGCTTGLHGGIARRAAYLKRARQSGIPRLVVFAGDLVAGTGELNRIRADTLMAALAAMKYDAATPGEMDLLEGLDAFKKRWASKPFAVSANLTGADGSLLLPEYLLKEFAVPSENGGTRTVKVAVTGVLSPLLFSKIQELSKRELKEFKVQDPTECLRRLVPKLRSSASLVVVLAHLGVPAAAQLGKDIPDIDVVVAGHNPAVSILSPPNLGGPILVAAGDRGRQATELRLKLGEEGGVDAYSAGRQSLDESIPNDPELEKLMEEYRAQAAEYGRKARAALAAMRKPEQAGPYVGAKVCAMCHTIANAQWKTTKHPSALEGLKKWHPSAAERIECLKCHVVGLGDPYGYIGEKETPEFAGVQCENCHGAGRKHVEAAWAKQPTAGTINKTPGEALCRSCHDEENDPKFDYSKSLPKVVHKGTS